MADAASVARVISERLIERLTTTELHDALSEVGDQVTRDAQRRAPVRQIFKTGKSGPRNFHYASRSERQGMIGLAKQMGIKKVGRSYPMSMKIRESAKDETRTGILRAGEYKTAKSGYGIDYLSGAIEYGYFGAQKRSSRLHSRPVKGYRMRDDNIQNALTSRARYNLSIGAGVHRIGNAIVIGGELRRGIGAEAVHVAGSKVSVSIVSTAPYSKYVEFGTYKDPAQPFMYPALKGAKKLLHAEVKRRLSGSGFKTKGG